MTRRDLITIVSLQLVLTAACPGRGADTHAEGGSTPDAFVLIPDADVSPDAAALGCPPDGPFTVECACPGAWSPGALPTPWWLASPPSSCVPSVTHDPTHAYDDCAPIPYGYTAGQCGAPKSGAIVCKKLADEVGRRTVTCLTDADCPSTMLCVSPEGRPEPFDPTLYSESGTCEKTCTGSGSPAECVRCDMYCHADLGVCLSTPPPPPPTPCVADCQCTGVCVGGVCNNDSPAPRLGICGADCPCNGGVCEGECCVLPDSTIATVGSPACTP